MRAITIPHYGAEHRFSQHTLSTEVRCAAFLLTVSPMKPRAVPELRWFSVVRAPFGRGELRGALTRGTLESTPHTFGIEV